MGSERHNEHLKQYLKSHKSPGKPHRGLGATRKRDGTSESSPEDHSHVHDQLLSGSISNIDGKLPASSSPDVRPKTLQHARAKSAAGPGSSSRNSQADAVHPCSSTVSPPSSGNAREREVKKQRDAGMSVKRRPVSHGVQQRQGSASISKRVDSGSAEIGSPSRRAGSHRSIGVHKHVGLNAGRAARIKPNMNNFPDELVMKILSYLSPSDLLVSARVCRRWLGLTNDNVVWHQVYQKFVRLKKGEKQPVIPKNPPCNFWKSLCINRCAENRNARAVALLKKVHPFTGLPKEVQRAFGASGTKWLMVMCDSDSLEHVFYHRDIFYFDMGIIVRWYSLELPPVNRIKKLKVMAANPVFFDKKLVSLPNSACQRSFLFELSFNWQDIRKQPPDAEDDAIEIRLLSSGLLIATWKDGGNLAFLMGSFHSHNLVPCCLFGTGTSPYIPVTKKPPPDDIDSIRGLHDYQCTLQLHNQRTSFWSQQFQNVYCKPETIGGGHAVFQLISPDSSFGHSNIADRKLNFLWKTDLFKGKVLNVCVLDVTVLDENRTPIWCVSSPVKVIDPHSTEVVYDYEGENGCIEYSDDRGKLYMKMIWEPELEQHMITCLEMHLSLGFINSWFRTSYPTKTTR